MLLAKADHASGLLRQAIFEALPFTLLVWIANIQFAFAFVFNFSAIKWAFSLVVKKKERKCT